MTFNGMGTGSQGYFRDNELSECYFESQAEFNDDLQPESCFALQDNFESPDYCIQRELSRQASYMTVCETPLLPDSHMLLYEASDKGNLCEGLQQIANDECMPPFDDLQQQDASFLSRSTMSNSKTQVSRRRTEQGFKVKERIVSSG